MRPNRPWQRCAAALAAGTGPAAVDTERASGFRYGQRAMLVQIRREGAGTWLIDPEAFDDLKIIDEALRGVEWILHAASQDLPCLAGVGMWPDKLFDTELAARLAGLPRVGLGAVVESLLGYHLAKEHSAADWSTRPLPEPWLRYAALDVEVLVDLQEELVALLDKDGKLEYAAQEFQHLIDAGVPAPRVDPWRRTSGAHTIRNRRPAGRRPRALVHPRETGRTPRHRPQPPHPGFGHRGRRQGHAHHRSRTAGLVRLPRPRRQARCAQVAPRHPDRQEQHGPAAPAGLHQHPAAAARVGRTGPRGRRPVRHGTPAPGRACRGNQHPGGKHPHPGLPAPRVLAPAVEHQRGERLRPAGRTWRPAVAD